MTIAPSFIHAPWSAGKTTQFPERYGVTVTGRQAGKTYRFGRGEVRWGREKIGTIIDTGLAIAGMDFGLTEARIVAQIGKATIDKVFWDELIKKQQQNTENQK